MVTEIKTPVRGNISDTLKSNRIVSHGKITDLSNDFSLPNQEPFSVYVRPKNASDAVDIIASVRCFQDDNFADAPLPLCDWSPLALLEVGANAIDLTQYDVYWGAGEYVENK